MRLSAFAKYAWVVLLYNIGVVLWGAYVRATGSGAGCGSHWPLCNGEVIPLSPQIETIIEFSHRITSGLSLILVLVLFVWAFRKYPRKHIVRLGAALSLVFIITEALVGAGLVLFEWVAQDASIGRVVSMAVHLINTFLLLAALTLTAWWASTGETISLKQKSLLVWVFSIGFIGAIILGVSGAITALGDTLFPVSTLAEGFQQDFSPTAHFLVRLRVWHPIIAIIEGSFIFLVSGLLAMFANDEIRGLKHAPHSAPHSLAYYQRLKKTALFLIGAVAIQLFAGLLNLLLLAPVWMQIVHLFLADAVWIGLILLAASVFALENSGEQTASVPEQEPIITNPHDVKIGNSLSKHADRSIEQPYPGEI